MTGPGRGFSLRARAITIVATMVAGTLGAALMRFSPLRALEIAAVFGIVAAWVTEPPPRER